MDLIANLSIEFIFAGAISGLVWLIRLEGKLRHVERLTEEAQKDVDAARARLEVVDSKMAAELARVRESLARIEGHMGIRSE